MSAAGEVAPVTDFALDRRRGGFAVLLGYLLVVVLFFRDPGRGLAAAGTPSGLFFVVVLPAAGLLSGFYAVVRGAYSGVGLFLTGSYLGIVGLTFGLGLVPAPGPVALLGLGLFVLSVVAVYAGLRSLWPAETGAVG
jgi:hypothetical protein